jgi:hypothetical protein
MGNDFKKHYDILIYEFENHPRFGLNSKYSWPYLVDDAFDLVSNAILLGSSTTWEIISYFEEMFQLDEDFRAYRSTPEGLMLDSTNLVDQIFYDREDLIISSWSPGVIVTSAIFCLVRSKLHRWKTSYDRVKKESNNFSDREFDLCPVSFLWPISWNSLLKLSVDPYVGPTLSVALKEFYLIKDIGITLRIISCLINSSLIIPSDRSFLEQGLANYLHIFGIDQVTILVLTDKVCTLESFKPLIIFLTNFKLEEAGILQSFEMGFQGTKAQIKEEFIDPYGISDEGGVLAVHVGIVHNSLGEDFNFLRNKELLNPLKAQEVLEYMIGTVTSRIDFLHSGFSHLEPTCPKWRQHLCQTLPSEFNLLIDRVKQYVRQQSISDITKDDLIAQLNESRAYSNCLSLDNFDTVGPKLSIIELQDLSADKTYGLCRLHGRFGGFGKYFTSAVFKTHSTQIYYESLTVIDEPEAPIAIVNQVQAHVDVNQFEIYIDATSELEAHIDVANQIEMNQDDDIFIEEDEYIVIEPELHKYLRSRKSPRDQSDPA